MGSFLAKVCRVLGKKVDQSCPDFIFFDPSLLPGAAVSSSVKPDVFLCWFGTRLLFFITNGETLESSKGGAPPAVTPCAVSGRRPRVLWCENNFVYCMMNFVAPWCENNPVFDVVEFLVVLWCENNPVLDVLEILPAVWCENNPVFDVLAWWAGVLCANPLARMFFSVT